MDEAQFLAEFIALRDQFPRGSSFVRNKGDLHCGDRWIRDEHAFRDALPDITSFRVAWDGRIVSPPPKQVEHYLQHYDGRFGPVSLKETRRHPLSDEEVRRVVLIGVRIELEKCRASIAKGVATRKRRLEAKLKEVTDAWLRGDGAIYANRTACVCCDKELIDPDSIQRGIGPACWEKIVRRIERARAEHPEAA